MMTIKYIGVIDKILKLGLTLIIFGVLLKLLI